MTARATADMHRVGSHTCVTPLLLCVCLSSLSPLARCSSPTVALPPTKPPTLPTLPPSQVVALQQLAVGKVGAVVALTGGLQLIMSPQVRV